MFRIKKSVRGNIQADRHTESEPEREVRSTRRLKDRVCGIKTRFFFFFFHKTMVSKREEWRTICRILE